MPTGIYISVPFCKQKCSFCNFASGVFSRDLLQCFVNRVCEDISRANMAATSLGAGFDPKVDTIYFGGGTPTMLASQQLSQLFAAVRSYFHVAGDAEITVECAPGTLSLEILETLVENKVNRVSLGVQSFVDREARSVGRLHDRATVLSDVERLRHAGIHNISVDLIAGLPHQTADSWSESLDIAIATRVPHLSVYLLEVDEDSRLGAELIAGGIRYHAHHVPNDDLAVDFYQTACERLNGAEIAQYEISNFARQGYESKHNRKYWTREPYFGFGLDAHSMLPANSSAHPPDSAAIRFSTSDDLEQFLRPNPALTSATLNLAEALEEEFFLGLRLNRGINLTRMSERLGIKIPSDFVEAINELVEQGLLRSDSGQICLTARGRLLSNEVFERFLGVKARTGARELASC